MKNIILTFGILATSISLLSQESYSEFIINEDKVVVNFNSKVEFTDLVNLKSELEKKGIVIDFKELKFNEENKLQDIAFSVNCNDGFSGTASKKFLKKNDTVGFYRYYEEGGGFGTGNVEKVSDK